MTQLVIVTGPDGTINAPDDSLYNAYGLRRTYKMDTKSRSVYFVDQVCASQRGELRAVPSGEQDARVAGQTPERRIECFLQIIPREKQKTTSGRGVRTGAGRREAIMRGNITARGRRTRRGK